LDCLERRDADQPCRSRRKWDEVAIDGDIKGWDCALRYKSGRRVLAVASI